MGGDNTGPAPAAVDARAAGEAAARPALEARLAALEERVTQLERRLSTVAALRWDAEAVTRRLAVIEDRLAEGPSGP